MSQPTPSPTSPQQPQSATSQPPQGSQGQQAPQGQQGGQTVTPTRMSASGASGASGGGGRARDQSRSGRRGVESREAIQRILSEMGSYSKYLLKLEHSPFDVRLRCQCGRSRPFSWMFLCTYCVTGKYKENPDAAAAIGATTTTTTATTTTTGTTPTGASLLKKPRFGLDDIKESGDNKDDNKTESSTTAVAEKPIEAGKQRPFLCCDLCAQRFTDSYYCPHCLTAYVAHHVKSHARCPRCVSCPRCASPLEKIIYTQESASGEGSSDKAEADAGQEKEAAGAAGGNSLALPTPASTGASGTSGTSSTDAKSQTYLYQCPFCFWSSNAVNLSATDGVELLTKLTKRSEQPWENGKKNMDTIRDQIKKYNDTLRDEIEEKQKIEKKLINLGGFRSAALSGRFTKKRTSRLGAGPLGGGLLSVPGGDEKPSKKPAPEKTWQEMEKELAEKKNRNTLHALVAKTPENEEAEMKAHAASDRYVQKFSLGTVAPLSHRFQEPLQQDVFLSEHLPQKCHLMTKESFRCPYKHCGSYVCKPTLAGRGANFDVRTAVLDYLPRVTLEIVSGGMVSTGVTKILMRFQNRHIEEAQIQLDPKINDEYTMSTEDMDLNSDQLVFDPYVTVENVECSKDVFAIDPMDIHTKKGAQPKDKNFPNGDFIKGKEAGIHLTFKPKFYEPTDVKFSLRVKFETKMTWTDEGKVTGPLQDVQLSYILDFFLGPTLKPGNPSSSAQPTDTENSEDADGAPRQHFPRMETQAQLFGDGQTRGAGVPPTPQMEGASEENGIDELDLDNRIEVETKARGSQEFKKPPMQE